MRKKMTAPAPELVQLVSAALGLYQIHLNAGSKKRAMRLAIDFVLNSKLSLGPSREAVRQKLRRIQVRVEAGMTIQEALTDQRPANNGRRPKYTTREQKLSAIREWGRRYRLKNPKKLREKIRIWRACRRREELELSLMKLTTLLPQSKNQNQNQERTNQ
jgi:alkanesulfonate monooxygenase SsuD/methylene tetrahydromethanopterin reductase-like flavin-dependent oxidoreductase (luciferase family)